MTVLQALPFLGIWTVADTVVNTWPTPLGLYDFLEFSAHGGKLEALGDYYLLVETLKQWQTGVDG